MTDRNERRRKRYAEDPEYRARVLASGKAYRKRNKKKLNAKKRRKWAVDVDFRDRELSRRRAHRATNKETLNARKRLRWATDVDFRDRALASQSGYRKRNKEELNAKERLRWATDVDFRERGLARRIAHREQHKEEFNAERRLLWATDPVFRRRVQKSARAWRLKCNYGLTLEDYDDLLTKQNGRCAICKKKPKRNSRLHVDHCHRRNIVRGLLCGNCNRGIGFLDEDPCVLRTSAVYVSRALQRKPRKPTKPARKKRR